MLYVLMVSIKGISQMWGGGQPASLVGCHFNSTMSIFFVTLSRIEGYPSWNPTIYCRDVFDFTDWCWPVIWFGSFRVVRSMESLDVQSRKPADPVSPTFEVPFLGFYLKIKFQYTCNLCSEGSGGRYLILTLLLTWKYGSDCFHNPIKYVMHYVKQTLKCSYMVGNPSWFTVSHSRQSWELSKCRRVDLFHCIQP